jgi:hypothetical protein
MPHMQVGRRHKRLEVVLVIAGALNEESCLIPDGAKLFFIEKAHRHAPDRKQKDCRRLGG